MSKSIRVTEKTYQQIAELKDAGFESITNVTSVAIDRLYQSEMEKQMNIEYHFDFDVMIDPYRADTGGRTEPRAYIRPREHKNNVLVVVEQTYPGQTGTDPDDLRDVVLQFAVEEYGEKWTPDPEAFEQYIKSPQAQILIRRIAEGYSTEWSGTQPGDGWLTATLNEDAQTALDAINAAIEELPADTREFWTMEEWCSPFDVDDLTDDEVRDMINDPTGGDDSIVIIDDPEEFFAQYQ